MQTNQKVHDAALAVMLEYAKRKPTLADQTRFYALLEELIGAAAAAARGTATSEPLDEERRPAG